MFKFIYQVLLSVIVFSFLEGKCDEIEREELQFTEVC